MEKCDICGYQKDCPNVVETDSLWCETHRTIPKDFDNEYIEKQQLIKFLEDKIKQTGTGIHNRALDFNCGLRQGKIEAFQEVQDFVNRGGKE